VPACFYRAVHNFSKRKQEMRNMLHNRLFCPQSFSKSIWNKIHLNTIEENAKYGDVITYWFYDSDYIWNRIANLDTNHIELVVMIIAEDTDSTIIGNLAYLALVMTNKVHRKHALTLYESAINFMKEHDFLRRD
jgi:hypothetical protein